MMPEESERPTLPKTSEGLCDYELLRLIYKSVDFDKLLRQSTAVSKADVDALFKRFAEFVKDEVETAARTVGQPAARPAKVEGLVIHLDGASRRNPGPAAFGVVVLDESGNALEEFGRYIGEATSNMAEYSGLIAAVQRALAYRAHRVVFKSDSELLVQQMTGGYRIKSRNIVLLAMKARRLLERLPQWRIEHVPREQNAKANDLAAMAIDAAPDEGGGKDSDPVTP